MELSLAEHVFSSGYCVFFSHSGRQAPASTRVCQVQVFELQVYGKASTVFHFDEGRSNQARFAGKTEATRYQPAATVTEHASVSARMATICCRYSRIQHDAMSLNDFDCLATASSKIEAARFGACALGVRRTEVIDVDAVQLDFALLLLSN